MKRLLTALVFAASTALSADPASNVLVQYSFDDSLVDTGPDTFAVFQNAKGTVRLSGGIRYSGYRSIELKDAVGDGDFPELQGYFPERAEGSLFFHFAMLITNPDQTLNVALAGPSHFSLTENGIAFWLKTIDGVLHHVSDSIPKKLFALRAFSWYVVDVRYDISTGTYDLRIREEGASAPVVDLRDQPNAVNAAGSSVDKFSFVGDVHGDRSSVTYYVDDVIIGTDARILLSPFVAPGRRKLFIDRWHETQRLTRATSGCAAPLSLADFGIRDADVAELETLGFFSYVRSLIDRSTRVLPEDAPDRARAILQPVVEWGSACEVMNRDATAAAGLFASAATGNPSAPIFHIGEVQALIKAGRHADAEARWSALEPILKNDLRYGMLAAQIGMQRNDWSEAERWLRQAAESEVTPAEQRLIVDEYYFVLLWKLEYRRAFSFAERTAQRIAASGGDPSIWLERTGDALFLDGAPAQARRFYEQALEKNPRAWGPNTKLSDVHFRLGNLERERHYREKVYGTLSD